MSATLALKLTSGRDELAAITDAVEDLGRRERWPDALLFRVNLALEELGLNIMDYGYDGGPCDIDIVLTSDDDAVTIEIIDGGPPFDPLHDAPTPDLDAAIEDRRIGGLGVYLVRTLMDDLRYRREEGKNHLTLVTRRAP